MTGRRQKLKTGAEWDLVSGWRHFLCYMQRAGVKKKLKKQLNKRERQDAKREIERSEK